MDTCFISDTCFHPTYYQFRCCSFMLHFGVMVEVKWFLIYFNINCISKCMKYSCGRLFCFQIPLFMIYLVHEVSPDTIWNMTENFYFLIFFSMILAELNNNLQFLSFLYSLVIPAIQSTVSLVPCVLTLVSTWRTSNTIGKLPCQQTMKDQEHHLNES